MKNYQLVAFDMDGTLLTSQKEISPGTIRAINAADAAGKTVVICTGRSPAECNIHQEDLKKVRYYICENGALLYDSQKDQILDIQRIEPEYVNPVLDIIENEDIMPFIYGDGLLKTNGADVPHMDHFHVTQYQKLAQDAGTLYEDVIASCREQSFSVEKINLYSASIEIRDRIFSKLSALPLTVVYAEETGIEVSPLHMSKAEGLRRLCKILSISLENTIMVGDSFNDLEAMKIAGLSVAMGNAFPEIKEVCDVTVSDNDHDGCVEVIESYLLRESVEN